MAKLSDSLKAAFKKPIFIHLSTLMPDGTPQASPIWVDLDGDTIVINSAQGRIKDNNMRRDPRVAISAVDPDNAYQPIMLRGRVVHLTTEGADAHIDKLAKKYLNKDKYPYRRPGEVRVIYRIEADVAQG